MGGLLGRVTPALLVAFLLGAATSGLQTVLPAGLAPLANSAGSWCVVAFVLALRAPRVPEGAGTAAVTLVALLLGYDVTAMLRGFGVSTASVVFWCAAALVVGPVLGAAAVVVRRRGPWSAPASLVLPSVLVLEGVHGWLVLRSTTGGGYWIGQSALGVLLAAVALLIGRSAGTPFADSEAERGLDRNT